MAFQASLAIRFVTLRTTRSVPCSWVVIGPVAESYPQIPLKTRYFYEAIILVIPL
jgi:hypothetical protein